MHKPNNIKISLFFSLLLTVTKLTPQVLNEYIENWNVEIIKTIPHDDSAFTQGLVIHNNYLFESTGQYGKSSIRKIDINSGKIIKFMALDRSYFAEGIAIKNNNLVQLTWKNQQGFVYDLNTFELIESFSYEGEGWGITSNKNELIISNGSEIISFYNSESYEKIKDITVTENLNLIKGINELEYINNEIWANIWYKDSIARISPLTGNIIGWINLENLYPKEKRSPEDVLNGIAYDINKNELFVTGKNWPYIFQIKIIK